MYIEEGTGTVGLVQGWLFLSQLDQLLLCKEVTEIGEEGATSVLTQKIPDSGGMGWSWHRG